MGFLELGVIGFVLISIVGILSDNRTKKEKLKVKALQHEIELEKLRLETYTIETEKMKLELEQSKLALIQSKQQLPYTALNKEN
ncbi:hypothetical protein [Lysinibacillus sp. 54212]|uniref:hypothetical protein n=1 Tax=Lysinibacillus sp. 54212 TaxID=3119829 RepID=UPI002FCB89AB